MKKLAVGIITAVFVLAIPTAADSAPRDQHDSGGYSTNRIDWD